MPLTDNPQRHGSRTKAQLFHSRHIWSSHLARSLALAAVPGQSKAQHERHLRDQALCRQVLDCLTDDLASIGAITPCAAHDVPW